MKDTLGSAASNPLVANPFAGWTLIVVGPAAGQPCGILDYVQRLIPELSRLGPVKVRDYAEAMIEAQKKAEGAAFLVHYERSRVPGAHYLGDLARLVGDRLFVVPHEVYQEDPFAFPMEQLKASWPLLELKKALYRWRHRPWFRELTLQAQGYFAKAVFPLNHGAARILKSRAPSTPLHVIPHARVMIEAARVSDRAMPELEFVWGLVGFVTPNNDYERVFQSLLKLPRHGLVLLGSERDPSQVQTQILKKRIHALGLDGRVHWAGYIADQDWSHQLASVDGFLAPFKHRSASGSLFLAMARRKPILAADMPLTREMLSLGAPLHLVQGDNWPENMEKASKNDWTLPPDTYAWTYERVAQMYWQTIIRTLADAAR